jgi:hypothetical protein
VGKAKRILGGIATINICCVGREQLQYAKYVNRYHARVSEDFVSDAYLVSFAPRML